MPRTKQNGAQLQLSGGDRENWARCLQSSAICCYAYENQFEHGTLAQDGMQCDISQGKIP